MKVSIVIPVYNEEKAVAEALNQVLKAPISYEKEIIVIDDGSTDKTVETIKSLAIDGLVLIERPVNKGKGAALRAGFEKASGDVVIVQDADLEYSPKDYPSLLYPIVSGKADVVFGSRFLGGGAHRVHLFWHYMANKFLTTLSNITTNLNLTDMEVGFKVFRTEVIKKVKLKQNRFGFEPEVTAKLAKLKCRIFEVPISYYGRSYADGKKIRKKDALSALWCIIRYGIF